MSDDLINAPGWGMIRLADLKEAVECGALTKKFGAGYWVWAVTMVDYMSDKGDRSRDIKAGGTYSGISQDFINWYDIYQKRKFANTLDEEAINSLFNEITH